MSWYESIGWGVAMNFLQNSIKNPASKKAAELLPRIIQLRDLCNALIAKLGG